MTQRRRREGGFALLFLMVALAATGGVVALMLGKGTALRAELAGVAEQRLALVRVNAAAAFEQNGAFPAGLTALATATGLDAAGTWRIDPYGMGQDLRWTTAGTPVVLTVRSVGPDGLNATADDLLFALDSQVMGRDRTRERLRIIRAKLLRSAYRDAGSMSAGDRANLRTWQRQYVAARRSYLHASTAQRTALDAQMTTLETNITNLCAAHGCPPLPATVGAIMAGIGLPPTMAVDGFGRNMLRNLAVGVVSAGGDGTGGTVDDM